MATIFSTGSGWYCGCLMTSESFSPRVSWSRVALSRSLANWAKAARARYCARSSLSGRATQQERHLAVGPGMLGEVVVDAQGVLDQRAVELDALLHDLLAHGDAGVRGEVLERRRVLGARDDDDGVRQGAVRFEHSHRLGHGGELLADGHVDADEALALLVDDRVHGEGRLARLPVADDQLALAAADGDECK